MGDFNWLNYPTSHGFFASYNPAIPDTPHFANDIGTPCGTSITALESGTVVSQREGMPWGTELFIKPDDGGPEYYYYHLDTLSTQIGQHVNAGDNVGLSGGQNSGGHNPTLPQYSTGCHTHVGLFTTYINTPVGSRAFGPDITPLINSLRGKSPVKSIDPVAQKVLTPPQLQGPGFTLIGQRIGLFLLAMVFVVMGFYMLFSEQVNAVAKKGLEVAAL